MIATLIGLIIITILAVIYFSSHQDNQDEDYIPLDKPVIKYEEDDMSQSYQGTLEDRNIAALQYENMKKSLKKHGIEDMDNQMMDAFHKVAIKLSTIGTNATPQEAQETPKEKGIPGGWSLE